jgi:hypothetical protein
MPNSINSIYTKQFEKRLANNRLYFANISNPYINLTEAAQGGKTKLKKLENTAKS